MKQRPGTSSVEYVVITGLISLACLSVVIVMHESNALTSVSDSLAFDENLKEMQQSPERRPADQPELGAAYSPQLVVINALCVLALGLVFIRRSREKRTKKQPVVCKVERIQQHSKALNVVLGKRSRVKSIVQEEWVDLLEGRASVGTYMSRELEVVSPHLKIEEADQKLRANGFRRVIVMHEDGRLAGVLSRKDIASKEGRVVADIMTSTPKTASPDMSLRIAQSILLQHRISCLPVVDNNQLVGVLSTSDLLIVLQCLLLILSNQNESDSFASATELVQPNVRSKALC